MWIELLLAGVYGGRVNDGLGGGGGAVAQTCITLLMYVLLNLLPF